MENISKFFLSFFAGNNDQYDQSYRPSNKMPPFFNSLQKLQDSLNDLKSEIKKYHCPSCGYALESNEKSNSAMETKPCKEERSPDVCQDQSNQGEKVFKHDKRDKKHDKAIPNSEKKQLEDRILELEKECKSLKMEISDQEDTIEQQFDKISRLSGMLEEREKTVSEQQSEIFRLNKSSKEFADEIQTRRNEISERDKRIENLENTQKNKEEEYEKSAQRLEDENRHLIEKLRSRQSEIEKFQTKLAEKDRINNDLSRRKSEIEVKCKHLERELEKRSRKEIAVGFHTTLAPPNSSLILGGLTSRLTERLAAEKVDLVRQAYSGGPDVNFPLLVVCVNVSRIGADAKEALKGIPKAKDVALLVFHHKEAHALPSQTSDKILTGADFSGLGSIIDLAFLSQRGIYECDMNNVGIERVASFLLQYKTQRK